MNRSHNTNPNTAETQVSHFLGKFLRGDEIDTIGRVSWLLDGIIPERSIAVLFGASNVGKSFLALAWALSVATGREWHGRHILQGPVLYIVGEGKDGFPRRRRAWLDKNGSSDADFTAVDCPVDFSSSSETEAFIAAVKQQTIQPALVVVDNFGVCFGDSDENDARDMRRFCRGIDMLRQAFNCTVIVIHNTGKNESGGARGSVALKDYADTMIEMRATRGVVELKCHKQRDGAYFAPISLRIASYGQSATVEPANKRAAADEAAPQPATNAHSALPGNKRTLNQTERRVLDVLINAGQPLRVTAITTETGYSDTKVYTALKALERAGHITRNRPFYSCTQPTGTNLAA